MKRWMNPTELFQRLDEKDADVPRYPRLDPPQGRHRKETPSHARHKKTRTNQRRIDVDATWSDTESSSRIRDSQ